ncbi:polyketide synthase, putative [Talaromyces stipitatus ATCC 10500]|uniref:Polyketide synthase, putative n=1 Tax=Talaromyces stipitatus (strain ATCC 10500 / CBS 375.48 / QM 6759 / NRRL 1006) TaxID=441959 RepID=B8MPF4_TALSN|nr:polyketide synthase, putative [Talaromyces stipitatus ATCC 10500]EED14393.1 polyketide synthase, putative [Talaromyces stipitatus ATCC 10500]
MDGHSPIAIIGLSYRAPGVGRKGLWEYLAEAKSAWSKVPVERFDYAAFHFPDKDKAGCIAAQGGHFLPDDIYAFDAPFFNLRAEEARVVDPHQRILLECALEAAESAGIGLHDLAGSNTGVFSAIGSLEHGHMMGEDMPASSTWTCVGAAPCMLANRLSYFFNLSGPSIALDAACASSTYAIHMACQSLHAGECEAAFAGGSALLLGPGQWSFLDTMGALSLEGRSFSYDARASGFGRGEGSACLLLKRLEDAIRCGDPIHAVIRNSACSHGGRSDGITMPSRSAQEKLLLRVHQEIDLDPAETPVVEGHGTGTKVGDPIEAGSFVTVLAKERTSSNPLYIGSLKSNFGHLEGASGVLGVVKAVMMLKHGCILPNANFEKFNEEIEGREKLRVPPTKMSWPVNEPRRVCVTNFGFGGSNSAIILDEAPAVSPKVTKNSKFQQVTDLNDDARLTNGAQPEAQNGDDTDNNAVKRLYVLSAKSESSLSAYLGSFMAYLDSAEGSRSLMKDLSYTLGQRRTHHSCRVAVTADSLTSLRAHLANAKQKRARNPIIAFVFTGQGAQRCAQMATGLDRYGAFRRAIEQVEVHLHELGARWSLKEELRKTESESRINEAEISQPACTAVQLALVLLLKSWGVEATAVTGHSSGEIAAAFAAGLISFEAAVAIAYFRGLLAVQLSSEQGRKGAMLALGISADESLTLLEDNKEGYATIAAINSPQSVTLSGDQSAIDSIHQMANTRGIFARRLRVEVAYHSRHMEHIAASYRKSIDCFCDVRVNLESSDAPRPVFISSVTGRQMDVDTLNSSYWVKNLLEPVRFSDAVESIFSVLFKRSPSIEQHRGKQLNVVLEIGPHSALQGPIKQTVDALHPQQSDQHQEQFAYVACLERGRDSEEAILDLSKNLFCLGATLQLAAVNQTDHRNARVLKDLPPYAWDKSTRYFMRSRITQAKLHPNQPYHPLLGWKSPYTEGSEVSFRQVFTLDEIPWIRDHNVGGHVIFPMTGYLSLAMEAFRRTASSCPPSILVREFHAKRSLEIEEDERVDIVTKLRPAATGTENISSSIWVFEILTWSAEYGWTTHCHGHVEAGPDEMTIDSPTFKSSAPLVNSETLKKRNPELEYLRDGREGTHYGAVFKRMVGLWEGPGWTVMENELRDLDSSQDSTYGSPVSVDTPTLDSCLQGLGPLLEQYGPKPALMPNYVSRLQISNRIPLIEKLRMTVVTRLVDYEVKAGIIRISVAVFLKGSDSLVPVAEWESVTLRTITPGVSGDSVSNLPVSYYWDLIPSLDHLKDDGKLRKILEIGPADERETSRVRMLNLAAVYYMDRALQETAQGDFSQLPSYLFRFRDWARTVVAQQKRSLDGIDTSALVDKLSSSGGQGEMMCALGEQLPQILRGEIQALEIMLRDNRLSKYYDDDLINVRLSWTLARWVRNLSDVKYDLRVLEIGAGTGSATFPVFQELSRGEEKLPDSFTYTYTDISAGFFEKAREKLAKWSRYITYKKLDISQDPEQQGFGLEQYDLIIASNVLHATPNMAATIDHVRSLLKPSGKLVMIEACRHAPLVLPFALLPGWWLAEDKHRSIAEGPLLSENNWNSILCDRGFSGLDNLVAAFPDDPENILNLISTTRVGMSESRGTASTTICGPLLDNEEEDFAQMVSDVLSEHLGCVTSIKPFAEITVEDDPFCIILDSPGQSIFKDFSSDTFELCKNVLLKIKGLLWVIPENHTPDNDVIKGLLRSVRLETGPRNLLILDNLPRNLEGVSAITQLAQRLQDPEMANCTDKDFTWHEGMMYLPRYRPLPAAKEVFASEAGVTTRKEQSLWQDGVSYEMTVDSAGSPDSIYFKRTDIFNQSLGNDDILIRIVASGVNFRDVLLVLGSIPWTRPGFEGAGVVLKTGRDVENLQPGDRVFFGALHGGSIASHIQLPSWMACKIPDGFNTVDAAGISVAYSTAIMTIMRIGRLRKGESILIHAASGAVGQACIVLAQHLQAEIFATAGSPAKRGFLHERFNIPKDHIFSSRTSAFRDGILSVTDGKGVDVIINSLSGNLLQETWAVIADIGRFVEIGKRDLLQNSYLSMRPFDRNVTFSGVDLRTFFLNKPDEHRACLSDLVGLVNRGVVVPIHPVTALPASQIATGMRILQSGQNIGKIVLTMDSDERVLAESPLPLQVPAGRLLRPDATYIITGGTGGIGLSLVPWMVEHGARNLVLLGRSGSSRPEVQKILEQYENTGIHVRAVSCDVGLREDLAQALQSIQDLPPASGVVHGALILRGAWNLHELLPDNLDFFVALSSFISGSGNIGQSIYSGTASFYDSFAEYRNSLGQPTVSVALPVVMGVGYVADHGIDEKLKASLGAILTEVHLRTVIKGAIIGPSSSMNRDGKAISFSFARGDDSSALPWQCFHPRALVDYIRAESRAEGVTDPGQGSDLRSKRLQVEAGSDPLEYLLDALMDRVSSITMIERDEIEPDSPLSRYSLDSLVSVELRTWIRRKTGVELTLPRIVNSENLRALARYILSQREVSLKKK